MQEGKEALCLPLCGHRPIRFQDLRQAVSVADCAGTDLMADEFIDHEARAMATDAKAHVLSHEAVDAIQFAQTRDDIKDMQKSQKELSEKMDGIYRSLNAKMDNVKDMIGSRPSWIVTSIISVLLGIIGFLSARVFPT